MRNLIIMNKAQISKLGYKIRSEVNALWCDVLRGKYKNFLTWLENVATKSSDSNPWRTIASVWPQLNNMVFWSVGNGKNIKAWQYPWVAPGLVMQDLLQDRSQQLANLTIIELINEQGNWNWNFLRTFFDQKIIDRISVVHPSVTNVEIDVCLWCETYKGDFSMANALWPISSDAGYSRNIYDWNNICHIDVHKRIRLFI